MNRGRHHHERHSNGQCTVSDTGSGAAFAKRPRALAHPPSCSSRGNDTSRAAALGGGHGSRENQSDVARRPAHEEWGGRHALDTIYCAIGVNDVVTATAKTPGSGFSLELSGEHLGDLASSGSDMRRNHAVLALFAIARAAGREPDVALHVDKHIPVGAGLGGGSADAAATLLAVNTLWGLHWPIERLRDIAATLGADMPFCLEGGYAHGTGFGERIIPLEDDSSCVQTLRDRGFAGQLLVGAYRAQLSTPNVYSTFDKMGAGRRRRQPSAARRGHLAPPQRRSHRSRPGRRGIRSFVSGSGPSVIAFVTDDGRRPPRSHRMGAIRHGGSHHRCTGAGETGHNRPAIPVLSRQTVTLICVPVS